MTSEPDNSAARDRADGSRQGSTRESAREAAAGIARTLAGAGFVAYFAGGCVRDRLLGLEPQDFDVATNASPQQIERVFPSARGVGASFGVMLVRRGGHTVEVATFRRDGEYIDGRRPSRVHFGDAEQDAKRRDFTVNGLFEEPDSGRVIDFVGGVEDVRSRLLRAIGSAEQRLAEDRLRMLRAVRFAARFDLRVDAGVDRAIRAHCNDLMGVSRERIGGEIRRILLHPTRGRGVHLIEQFGLDASVLREPAPQIPGQRVAMLAPDASLASALVGWMLDRSGTAGPDRRRAWADALVLSNAEAESVAQTLEILEELRRAWRSLDKAKRKRHAARSDFRSAVDLLRTEDPALAEEIASQVEALRSEGLAPAPFVTGDDLIALGAAPGPAFRRVLDTLYDRQLRGEFGNRAEALAAARAIVGT